MVGSSPDSQNSHRARLYKRHSQHVSTAVGSLASYKIYCIPVMFYAPGHDMQRPTHARLHVRDARDAQTVFEAVRRGALRPVVRRLNEMERAMFIQSGAIFVWEESDDELGLKRWTDGRVWSQSRMREV